MPSAQKTIVACPDVLPVESSKAVRETGQAHPAAAGPGGVQESPDAKCVRVELHRDAPAGVSLASATKVATAHQRPTIPKPDDTDADTAKIMHAIISYVKAHLRTFMKDNKTHFDGYADTELHLHTPLLIQDKNQGNDMLSLKAAWSQKEATSALSTTSFYEAGGNLFWCNAFPIDDEASTIAGQTPS